MSPERDHIRNTLTLRNPQAVRWIRQQEAAGVGMSEAISDLIIEEVRRSDEVQRLRETVQELRDQVAFLKEVIRSGRGGTATAPAPKSEASGWGDFPDEYLEP